MSDGKSQQEPTMEEILASIRRIISEDGAPAEGTPEAAPAAEAAPAPKPPVLELTDEVKDDGSVVSVAPPPPPQPEPPPAAAAPPPPPPPPPVPPVPEMDDIELVSAPVADAAAAQLGALAGAVSATRSVPLGNTNKTLEDVVRELLRPMLKQWLDANLQPIVQRIVEREVAKLSSRADADRFR